MLELELAPAAEEAVATSARRDPHHEHLLGVAVEEDIVVLDLRAGSGEKKRTAHTVYNAHAGAVLDLDFNPNKPYAVASGGEDCCLRFWDLRKSSDVLLSLQEDSHW